MGIGLMTSRHDPSQVNQTSVKTPVPARLPTQRDSDTVLPPEVGELEFGVPLPPHFHLQFFTPLTENTSSRHHHHLVSNIRNTIYYVLVIES